MTELFSRSRRRTALAAAALLLAVGPAGTIAQEGAITPNYQEADIRQIIDAVGAVTGKSFIVDPRVKAQVTMLSSQPLTPDAFYEAFLSILDVYGFTAIDAGNVTKIIPQANARQLAIGESSPNRDEMITRVIEVKNIGAAQLVPSLRPLQPQHAHLAAHTPSNMLIITDTAANVARLLSIVNRIDRAGDEEIEIVPLTNASATDVVRVVSALSTANRADGAPSGSTNLVADERTNSVLISGERNARIKLRTLIAHLDTPLEDGGNTQVRYLRYALAEDLATKLQTQFSQGAAGPQAAGGGAGANSPVTIWADEPSNALVITAPPKVMRAMMSVIDKLDIRRAQVLVEAIIVEVTADKAAELGVTWAADGSNDNNVIGVTNFPGTGTNVLNLAGTVAGDDLSGLAGAIGDGITVGVGRLSDSGTSFAAIISALEGDANTNVISTPTIVTLDNEEAKIEVGQEVPFISGQFTNTGGGTNTVNPFQTVNREQIGTLLEITPQINEGDAILMKIRQETSSISQSSAGAVDLITNERSIETSVIVEDGGILVLGGLIDDTLRESDQRVPVLGRLPLIGNLFRSRSTSKVKSNLMVFIRPRIIRDGTDMIRETNSKYNYMRDQQLRDQSKVPLMRRTERPVLPTLDEALRETPAAPPNIMDNTDRDGDR